MNPAYVCDFLAEAGPGPNSYEDLLRYFAVPTSRPATGEAHSSLDLPGWFIRYGALDRGSCTQG